MDEQEFEGFLANAYRVADAPERPDLADAILARAQRRRRRRTAVLGLAAIAGVGIVAAALSATGVARALAHAAAHLPPEPAMINPSLVVAVGIGLMVAAAIRSAVRGL